MSSEEVIGFWSYSHEDDKLDGGGILRLSRLIMEEYDLLAGEPIDLFVDRKDIAWGQEWQERIESSLAQTTFFIPIITPRYFRRPECRRELLEFAAKAKMLGVEELLLPILYVETPGLSPENPDEAVALVARTQYVDWRVIRLCDASSNEYRTAVNALVQRLLQIAQTIAERQIKRELAADLDDEGSAGITDVVSQINALLPDWLDAVLSEKSNSAQISAIWHHQMGQIHKLQARGAAPSAILSTEIRMARELLPTAARAKEDSQIYLARSIELDPLVSALARLIAEHPDSSPLATPVKEAVEEAMEPIRQGDIGKKIGVKYVQDSLRERNHLGRVFQQINRDFSVRYRCAVEGNDIVRRWERELSGPARDQSEPSSG